MNNLKDRLSHAVAPGGRPTSDYDLNADVELPAGRKLTPAAVLVAVTAYSDRPELLLTKRSSRLSHHPGQIAFPGGKQDPTDADATATALREAEEEVGLPDMITMTVGTMDPHETVTGFLITPVIALVRSPFDPVPETGEVEEVFRVPLDHVLDPTAFQVQSRRWRGRRRFYYAVPWGPYYIWGATARILRAIADRVT
ncbi:MAG: CoA pyrophosphatase [Pseudomonadota bacterium]